jgi:catechol 2,3-dioxygenase-like lactoylglutathione lyase family enzyme
MARGLDHIVHAVRDLDAAAELYQSLGFTVGARNKHPWGTHNRIIQLDGSYIELLTVGEPEKITPHGAHSFSFGAFHRDFLAREQGLAMLLLNSGDAKADNAAWRTAGIGDFDVFSFEREGKRPDGSAVKLAFSLIFVPDPNAPDAGFGACQHYYPENFWNPAFQKHANGAQGVAGVVMVADEPARHRDFLLAFTGAEKTQDTNDGFGIALPRGAIDMMTPAAFTRRFGLSSPDTSRGARLVAIRFAGASVAASQQAVLGAGLVFERS